MDFRGENAHFRDFCGRTYLGGAKGPAEAGLLGVVQLSRVVERCHNVPLSRGMDRQLVATTPRADTTGSRALSSAWRQARDEKVIAREDGYTYIAALRSPDLRHTTKREGDTSVTVVTSNYRRGRFFWCLSVSTCLLLQYLLPAQAGSRAAISLFAVQGRKMSFSRGSHEQSQHLPQNFQPVHMNSRSIYHRNRGR